MSAKIVLVTSGQPSLNPRLVKEADTLTENGYEVLVIYAYWNQWASDLDQQLLADKKWTAIRAGGHPLENRFTYLISRIIFKVANFWVREWKWYYFIDAAVVRASYFLKKEARKHPADFYIGHNLGALPAVVHAAKKYGRPAGFDLEDLHRYETSDDDSDPEVFLKLYVENKYLPQVIYVSASSVQTANFYKGLFPNIDPLVLRNVFPKQEVVVVQKPAHQQSLKLFWFSQTIGERRGLEDVIKALQILNDPDIELHLLGDKGSGSFTAELDRSAVNITYHRPMPQDQLVSFSSQFDIGLALEPGFSKNNDFALSNKIFTYLMGGLAVIASDTTAQTALLAEYPGVGKLYKKNNSAELADLIRAYATNKDDLNQEKHQAYTAAHSVLNWNVESKKFLERIQTLLSA